MSGGSSTKTVQQPATMSPEVSELLKATVPQQTALIGENPLVGFGAPHVQRTAPLGFGQTDSIRALLANLGMAAPSTGPVNLEDSALREAYTAATGRGALAGDRNTDPAVGGTPFTQEYTRWANAPRVGATPGPLLRPDELQALAYLKGQAGTPGGGDIGSAPATVAARNALETEFKNFTLPIMQSELNKAGLATSGAYGDALAKASAGTEAALVPFLFQEAGLQQNAGLAYVQALLGAGGTEEARATARPQAAFTALDPIRANEQQQSDAVYQDFLRRQNLTENVTAAGNSFVPASFGRTTNADTRGGGLLGALFGGGSK